jgi:hypothetical protein
VKAARHQLVMQLFHDALAEDRDQRAAFLRTACGADERLRAEVESLLDNHQSRTILIRRAGSTAAPSEQSLLVPHSPALGRSLSWTRAGRRDLQVGLAALTLALAVLGLGYWLETGIERPLRANLSAQLQATLDSNVAAVTHWLELQKRDVEQWAAYPQVRENFPAVVELAKTPGVTLDDLRRSEPYRSIMETIAPILQSDEVQAIYGTDRTGLVVLASRDTLTGRRQISETGATPIAAVFLGHTVSLPPLLGHTLLEGDPAPAPGEPIIVVGSPVRDGNAQIIGGLFASAESKREFTRLLGLGRASVRSDTYAFDPQGQLLSASRSEQQLRRQGSPRESESSASLLPVELRDPGVDLTAGLNSRQPGNERPLTKMAAAATAGEDGMDLNGYRDYRGVPVIGAWKWLGNYGFGIATEIEYDEAYAALTHVRRSFWTVFSLLATSAALAFVFALSTARLRREVGAARQLGQYTLEELIGEGGMGKVYKAKHALLRRPTAIKVLDSARTDRAAIARFEREVQVASSLTHPNTVEIYDYGRTEDDVFFFAMEYLPGVTLDALVRSEGRICAARVLHILRQVLGSLAEAHALGLVHRDVKPANVILCQRGGVSDFVKVVDFGLAMDPSFNLAPQITQTGLISGTPLYIAPECLDDPAKVSARSDLYAVGAVTFYLLTGRELFVAANPVEIFRCVTSETRPRPSAHVPTGIPIELDELVFSCVAKDPADRPASARDMLSVVASIAANHVWSDEDADRWWHEHCENRPLLSQ